jgi:Cupin
VDGSTTAKFHLVLDGQATLTLDDPGATRVTLAAGELVLLAHGSGHLMQGGGGSSARPLDHILAEGPSDPSAPSATLYGWIGASGWIWGTIAGLTKSSSGSGSSERRLTIEVTCGF